MKKIFLIFLPFIITVTACSNADQTVKTEPGATQETVSSEASPNANQTVSEETDAAHWEQVSPDFAVMGRVTKGIDTANTTAAGTSYEYSVIVKIKNTGAAAIDYDKAMLSFVPVEGKPFEMEVTSRDLKDQRKVKTETLKNGDSKEWQMGTNGWTRTIIESAGGKPLAFAITVKSKGKTVAGPFQADLPSLEELPLVNKDDAQQTAVYLKFKSK